jgi:hypothetical protein
VIKLSGQYAEERQSGKIGHAIVFPQEGKRLEEELRRCLRPKNAIMEKSIDKEFPPIIIFLKTGSSKISTFLIRITLTRIKSRRPTRSGIF